MTETNRPIVRFIDVPGLRARRIAPVEALRCD